MLKEAKNETAQPVKLHDLSGNNGQERTLR